MQELRRITVPTRAKKLMTCGSALQVMQVMQRRKTINDSLQQNSGPFCLYYAFALMAVTLAECLAESWQSGLGCQVPPIGQGNHPSGRSAYLLMGRRRVSHAAAACRAIGPNSATLLPRHAKRQPRTAKSRQVSAKPWYLRERSWRASLPPIALASWSHALPSPCPVLAQASSSHAGPLSPWPSWPSAPACLEPAPLPASPDRGRSLGPAVGFWALAVAVWNRGEMESRARHTLPSNHCFQVVDCVFFQQTDAPPGTVFPPRTNASCASGTAAQR